MDTLLEEIKSILENAHRLGSEQDKPEGARYIQLSDTLAKRWLEKIQIALKET